MVWYRVILNTIKYIYFVLFIHYFVPYRTVPY